MTKPSNSESEAFRRHLEARETARSDDAVKATGDDVVEARAWEALAAVVDPELHYDIVDLGLVYGVVVSGGEVQVNLTLTSPACPYGPYLIHQARSAVEVVEGVRSAKINLVWEPPWNLELMSEEARLELGFDV